MVVDDALGSCWATTKLTILLSYNIILPIRLIRGLSHC